MDKENELILGGIGACPYCGQAVAVDRREDETPADAAARVCDCIGARQAREDARRRENARALIEELFGERCREVYGLEPVTPEAQALLVAAADRIIEGSVSSAAVAVTGICKATLRMDGSGSIRAKRQQGRVIERTEGH